MKVFITGATGYVGGAVAREFLRAGHQVGGLARSAETAARLERLGIGAVRGSMQHPAAWKDLIGGFDAFVHAAVDYAADIPAVDGATLDALIEAARAGGEARCLIFTSGVWVLGETGDRPAAEDASTQRALPMVAWRPAHERRALEAASRGLATAVVRPGLVYGGRAGLLAPLFASAEQEGASVYIGAGDNRWSLVHRDDLGALYRLIAESRARGIFHGVDGASLPVVEVARAASRAAGRGGKTRSQPVGEARRGLGPVADALLLDQVVAAPRSRALGWAPRYVSFEEGAPAAYREWKGESVARP